MTRDGQGVAGARRAAGTERRDVRGGPSPGRDQGEKRRHWWTFDPLQLHIYLEPRVDPLLILAALVSLLSLYLPWLPGIYGPVPGWMVPYATPDISLDQIRYLEDVVRPDSIFLLSFAGIMALVFCRTSRYAGIRDLVATVMLVAGGGYLLIYFADEWGWCLSYNYVGPYAAFGSLALMVVAGLLRTRFMPWIPRAKVLLLASSAFLVTGWFMPWSLDESGVRLLVLSPQFVWLGSLRPYALLMPIFPLLGMAAFASAFADLPLIPRFMRRCWPLCFGTAALIYFRVVWARYLVGFPLGSWGTLSGLTLLTVAGCFQTVPRKPFLALLLVGAFVIASILAWLSFITGQSPLRLVADFFSVSPIRF